MTVCRAKADELASLAQMGPRPTLPHVTNTGRPNSVTLQTHVFRPRRHTTALFPQQQLSQPHSSGAEHTSLGGSVCSTCVQVLATHMTRELMYMCARMPCP